MATVIEDVGLRARPAALRATTTVRQPLTTTTAVNQPVTATSPCPRGFTYRQTAGRCFCDPILQGFRGFSSPRLGEEIPCPQTQMTTAAKPVLLYQTAPSPTLAPVAQQQPVNQPLPYISKNAVPEMSTAGPAPGTVVEQPSPDPKDMVFPTAPNQSVVLDVEKQDSGSPWLVLGAVVGAGLLFVLFTSRSEDRE